MTARPAVALPGTLATGTPGSDDYANVDLKGKIVALLLTGNSKTRAVVF
jgi:hypothetical protein